MSKRALAGRIGLEIGKDDWNMTNAIEIHGLVKAYPGFTLGPVDLTLPGGCILGLIGENGAGKSTLIRLILDMVQRDGGTVSVLGRDNRDRFRQTKEDIGVVFDETGVPACLSARQYGRVLQSAYGRWSPQRYAALLQKLRVPQEKPFSTLSRGNQMKVSIAAALAHDAKLLLLDEPTSGLDPVVREEIVDLFSEFTRDEDHAVLISSHIVSDLEKICDYTAFLHEGKLLLCAEKDRLLERCGVVHGTAEQLSGLAPAALLGRRRTAYGEEALVERRRVPAGLKITPVNLEDIFVFMVRDGANVCPEEKGGQS